MSIVNFLGVFFKRVILFCIGFVVAFPIAANIGYIGMTIERSGYITHYNYNTISVIIAIVVFLLGIGIMYYAVTLKQPQ